MTCMYDVIVQKIMINLMIYQYLALEVSHNITIIKILKDFLFLNQYNVLLNPYFIVGYILFRTILSSSYYYLSGRYLKSLVQTYKANVLEKE